ncbi:hypothetical protein L484_007867 [Morus notabilis]|uniref:Uncharacterized protein n=1 Tax=Morus notabilis TaxID=981085 RepID=W9QGA2_9ROSA|nr:uncharacterized protein LOC21391258 [Morus notabilis]EXB36805.1 hypothetical protein L484_007867 [Morus notabilis]
MANTEDFSFPKLTNTNKDNINNYYSLSLWRISSLVYPDQEEEEEEEDKEEDYGVVRKHKSFSEIEVGDSETRMDLLWEDFNEKELQRVSSLDNRIKSRRLQTISSGGDNHVTNDAVNNCGYFNDIGDRDSNLLQGLQLKVSKKRSSLVRQPKRTSTVALLRALRKMFSLHKVARLRRDK